MPQGGVKGKLEIALFRPSVLGSMTQLIIYPLDFSEILYCAAKIGGYKYDTLGFLNSWIFGFSCPMGTLRAN